MTAIFFFPHMLLPHIEKSKLKIPENIEHYNKKDYPHFYVFECLHLGVPIDVSALEDNANIIAEIGDEDIFKLTLQDMINRGSYICHDTYLA